jgi:hypothetical protein
MAGGVVDLEAMEKMELCTKDSNKLDVGDVRVTLPAALRGVAPCAYTHAGT